MAAAKDDKKQIEPPTRRNWPEVVGANARVFGLAAFAKAGFRDPTLVLHWDIIAGPSLSKIARPLKFSESPRGGILTLKAEPGAAIFLQHESRALCERINAYLGRSAVAHLRFVQGALAERGRLPAINARKSPVSPSDPAMQMPTENRLREALLGLAATRAPDRGRGD